MEVVIYFSMNTRQPWLAAGVRPVGVAGRSLPTRQENVNSDARITLEEV